MFPVAVGVYLPCANFRLPGHGAVQLTLPGPPPLTILGQAVRMLGARHMPQNPLKGGVFCNVLVGDSLATISGKFNEPKAVQVPAKDVKRLGVRYSVHRTALRID